MASNGLRLLQGGRASDGLPGLLIENAAEVATLAGGLRVGSRMDDPAVISAPGGDARHETAPAVATWEGRILAAGPRNDLLQALEGSGYPTARFARLDAMGGTVTPGLIDPHTHLLFGGSRENELVLRQRGADYLEILQAGGGILSTVAATRAATEDQLLEHGRRWLGEMLAHGTTTIEAKSGYGLDLPSELRLLEVAHRLGKEGPIDVHPTWLGAHAVPPEFRARPDGTEAYVRHLLEEQLPGVAAQGRAKFADAFCERGVFSPAQSRRVLREAARLGLPAAAPRRRAGPERRRGARRGARCPVGGPPRGALARRHRRPRRRGRQRATRSSRSSSPRQRGSSCTTRSRRRERSSIEGSRSRSRRTSTRAPHRPRACPSS